MKSITKKLITLLLAFSLVAAMPAAAFAETVKNTIPITVEAQRYDEAAEEVLRLVNIARLSANKEPLTLDSSLQEAAMIRAAESVVLFDHTRPDGTSCTTVNKKVSGENLAVGYGSPEAVVTAWLESSKHKDVMLNGQFKSIGIGCVYYNGVFYWSQDFGTGIGDGKIQDSDTITQKIDLMTSLVELQWLGTDRIDLSSNNTAETQKVQLRGINSKWEYGSYEIDESLFSITSSDENVIKCNIDGNIIPVSVGTADVTATYIENPNCFITKTLHVIRTLNAEDVKLSYSSCTYSGKAKKPTVTIEGLTEEDYVVSYKNNVKVGTATVTITGVGDVSGTVTKTFKINYDRPDQVSLKSPTTGKTHYVKARWYDEDCDGYQIRYATNSSFKNSKSIYVKDGDQLTRTIKNLKKGKRYYVKVRAYNNYEDTKVFGKWSKWKSVVCK